MRTIRGLVFRKFPYSENGIILKIYTRESGLMTFILKTFVSQKNKFQKNLLYPLSPIEITYNHFEKKDIQRIKEIKPVILLNGIMNDIKKTSILFFINELLVQTIKEEEQNEALFDFIFQSILALEQSNKEFANFHLIFSLHLTKYLGFFPKLNRSTETSYFDLQNGEFIANYQLPKYSLDKDLSLWFYLIASDNIADLNLNNVQRQSLLLSILDYYYLHLQGIQQIKSVAVLHTLFQ